MMNLTPEQKESILFTRLVITFQAAAIQYLGKLPDPISGKTERNLEQAAMTIDTLDMLRTKCSGRLTPDEERLLEHTISELKLNYVDEVGRSEPQSAGEPEQPLEPTANGEPPAAS